MTFSYLTSLTTESIACKSRFALTFERTLGIGAICVQVTWTTGWITFILIC